MADKDTLPLRTRAVASQRILHEANLGKRPMTVDKGLAEKATGKKNAPSENGKTHLSYVSKELRDEMDSKGVALVNVKRKGKNKGRNPDEQFE